MGNGDWGIGIGVGIGIGIENREPSADSRKRIAETGEWGVGNGDWDRGRDRGRDRDWESGAVGGQRAVIWLISAKMNVYKEGL